MDEIAALLAVLAAICFALAATLWQRASMALGVSAGQPGSFVRLLGNGVWLLGLAVQVVGVLLQAAALDRERYPAPPALPGRARELDQKVAEESADRMIRAPGDGGADEVERPVLDVG